MCYAILLVSVRILSLTSGQGAKNSEMPVWMFGCIFKYVNMGAFVIPDVHIQAGIQQPATTQSSEDLAEFV